MAVCRRCWASACFCAAARSRRQRRGDRVASQDADVRRRIRAETRRPKNAYARRNKAFGAKPLSDIDGGLSAVLGVCLLLRCGAEQAAEAR